MATTLHAQSDLSVAIQQETAGYDATLNVDVTLTSDQAVSAGQWDAITTQKSWTTPRWRGRLNCLVGCKALLQLVEPGIFAWCCSA